MDSAPSTKADKEEVQNEINQPSAKPSRKEFDLHEDNSLDNIPGETKSGKMSNMLLRKQQSQFFKLRLHYWGNHK